jgi:hypothetical protein
MMASHYFSPGMTSLNIDTWTAAVQVCTGLAILDLMHYYVFNLGKKAVSEHVFVDIVY